MKWSDTNCFRDLRTYLLTYLLTVTHASSIHVYLAPACRVSCGSLCRRCCLAFRRHSLVCCTCFFRRRWVAFSQTRSNRRKSWVVARTHRTGTHATPPLIHFFPFSNADWSQARLCNVRIGNQDWYWDTVLCKDPVPLVAPYLRGALRSCSWLAQQTEKPPCREIIHVFFTFMIVENCFVMPVMYRGWIWFCTRTVEEFLLWHKVCCSTHYMRSIRGLYASQYHGPRVCQSRAISSWHRAQYQHRSWNQENREALEKSTHHLCLPLLSPFVHIPIFSSISYPHSPFLLPISGKGGLVNSRMTISPETTPIVSQRSCGP